VERPVRASKSAVRYDPSRLAVSVQPSSSRGAIASLFARAGVTVEHALPAVHAYMVGFRPGQGAHALAVLRASPLVRSAEREILVSALDWIPDDTYWLQQWGLRLAGFPEAWSVTRGSSRTVVAVVDTGVDPTQPDLRGALVPGYDLVNSDADPSDDEGHGTAVAGVIAARTNNAAGLAGICWSCSIMPVKVLDAKGSGDDSVIAAGIVWAVDHGADVVNLSLGGAGVTQDLNDAIAYAASRNVMLIAAAGNSGTDEPFYPAANPLTLSVAATTSADQRYPWSNFGAWVRVAAPGCNIAPAPGTQEVIFCGTSSATPVVSGLAALAYAADPNASPAQVQQALELASVPLPVSGIAQYGRIDAPRTLSLLDPRFPARTNRATTVFQSAVDARTTTRRVSLTVGAGPVTATLTFPGGRRLSLSLVAPGRRGTLGSVSGTSPIQLRRPLQAGPIRLTVKGATRTAFNLALSHTPAPNTALAPQ
jgi:subtilisin family serine protease